MPYTKLICGDDSCCRLGDISVGDEPDISVAGVDLLSEREESVGIDEDIAVGRGDAVGNGKRDTVTGLRDHSSDGQIIDIIEGDDPGGERVARSQSIHIVAITQQNIARSQ